MHLFRCRQAAQPHFAVLLLLLSATAACIKTGTETTVIESPIEVSDAQDAVDGVTAQPDDDSAVDDAGTGDVAVELATVAADDVPPPDEYTGIFCSTNAACKVDNADKPYCNPVNHQCVQCLFDGSCNKGEECAGNQCKAILCKPGSQICDGNNLKICKDDGASYALKNCPGASPVCTGGVCLKCLPSEVYCGKSTFATDQDDQVMQCSLDGTAAKVLKICDNDKQCLDNKCVVCQAGLKHCAGDTAQICAPNGLSWQLQDDCGFKNFSCEGGKCVDPCNPDFQSNANVGCDFFAVDLHNVYGPNGAGGYLDAQNSQFAVVVGNSSNKIATITATAGTGQSKQYAVSPNNVRILLLPDPSWKDAETGKPLKPLNQLGTSVNKNVYRIQTDQPLTAYQFNPLQN